jgi:hypothetical protein
MPRSSYKVISWLTLLSGLSITVPAFGWHDKTHMAISQAAGYENWYNSAAPDVTKTKAADKEAANHWFNNCPDVEITAQMVLDQAQRYNDPNDNEGHLYGAIIAALREYNKAKKSGNYAEYHMAFCAHYIGDLSMPLHNVPDNPYGGFNDTDYHQRNENVIEDSVQSNIKRLQDNMYNIAIKDETDLAREIARIANISRQLAKKLKMRAAKKMDITPKEAYEQVGHSASLLKAVLAYDEGTKQ